MSATERLGTASEVCDMDAASMGYYAEVVEEVVQDLEAENKRLRAELETATEALAGAHRVIRHQRDKDSVLPAEAFQFAPGTI